MAKPDTAIGEELIETLTEREGIPYNQSWALIAPSRIVDLPPRPSATISPF